jgi:hypothetical protein
LEAFENPVKLDPTNAVETNLNNLVGIETWMPQCNHEKTTFNF